MISGIKPPPISDGTGSSPRGPAAAGRFVEYDDYIQAQLSKTRGHVRSVDFATELMVWLVGGLLFLFAVALADHWVVAGGLGTGTRFVAFTLFVGAGVYYFVRHLLPLLLRPINSVYAAYTIEQSKPTLKNALINFLMFRQHPDVVSPAVYEAIEQQAATRLAQVPVDAAVDRSKLIRVGYALLAVVFIFALYKIFSPKDPFQTVERVLMPWSDISAPTRIVISDVSPGSAQAVRGQPVKITAHVRGVAADDKVLLYYSSADGQTVDQRVEMFVPSTDYRQTCLIPAGDQGMQQDLEYRITAGDATTRRYKISVVAAPTIVVDRIEYQYPDYTGLVAQQTRHQGDIKGIEGTQVTIHALANQPIKEAFIDFDCDNTRDQPLAVTGTKASVTIPLSLEQGVAPHASYQILFTNTSGHSNQQPVRYPIEVLPDLAPEIQFLAPSEVQLELPLNGSVELELTAIDPDFALRKVAVVASHGGSRVEKALLSEMQRGRFGRKFRFEPGKMKLKPGDILEYWAYADDNKLPTPNRSETGKRQIRMLAPIPPRHDQVASADRHPRDPEQAPNQNETEGPGKPDQGSPQENPGEGDPNRTDSKQADGGKQDTREARDPHQDAQGNDKGDGAQGNSRDAQGDHPNDQQQQPVSNKGDQDGDAIERILKHREQQEKQEPNDNNDADRGNNQQNGEQQPGEDAGQPNQNNQGPQESGNSSPQNTSQQNPAQQNPGQQQGGAGDQNQGSEKAQGNSGQAQGGRSGNSTQAQDRQSDSSQQRSSTGNDQSGTGKAGGQQHKSGQQNPASTNQSRDPNSQSAGGQQSGTGEQQRNDGERRQQGDPSDRDGGSQQPRRPDSQQTGDPGGDKEAMSRDKTDQHAGHQPNSKDGGGQEPQPNPGRRGQGDKSETPPPGEQSNSESKEQTGGNQGDKHTPDQQRGACKNCGGKGCEHCEGKAGSQGAQGQSGAGKSGQDKAGSPEAMKANRDRPKSDKPSEKNDTDKTDRPSSASQSPHQSDSDSQQDGEQSGGGDKGGGQKAQSEGTGSPGEHSPADEGAGSSQDSGSGDTANRPGDKQQGNSGGKPGTEKGNGQTTQSAGKGSQQQPGGKAGGSPSANRTGGGGVGPYAGKPGDDKDEVASDDHAPQPPKTPDKAEQANLDYARKATELAIEHLKDQLHKEKPDQELLDRLGWSRDDLSEFLRRWQRMQRGAKRSGAEGEAARKELDDTLRSLGLRPQMATRRADTGRGDDQHRVIESRRTSPPAEYAEQYQAYTQGTARGGR